MESRSKIFYSLIGTYCIIVLLFLSTFLVKISLILVFFCCQIIEFSYVTYIKMQSMMPLINLESSILHLHNFLLYFCTNWLCMHFAHKHLNVSLKFCEHIELIFPTSFWDNFSLLFQMHNLSKVNISLFLVEVLLK